MLLRNVSFVRKLKTFSDYQLETSVIIELYIKRRETNRDRESLLHFLFHLRIRLIKTYGDFFYIELQLAVKITPTWQSMPPGLYRGNSFLVEPQNSKRTFIYLHDRPLGYSAIRGHREEIHVVIKVIFLPFYL